MGKIVESKVVPDIDPTRRHEREMYKPPVAHLDENGNTYFKLTEHASEQMFFSRLINGVEGLGMKRMHIADVVAREVDGKTEYYSMQTDPNTLREAVTSRETKAQIMVLRYLFNDRDHELKRGNDIDMNIIQGKPKVLAPWHRPVVFFDLGGASLGGYLQEDDFYRDTKGCRREVVEILTAFKTTYQGEDGLRKLEALATSMPQSINAHFLTIDKKHPHESALWFQKKFMELIDRLLKVLNDGVSKGHKGFIESSRSQTHGS